MVRTQAKETSSGEAQETEESRIDRDDTMDAEVLNIDFVSERNLCNYCGTCYGLCPKDNIRIERLFTGNPIFKAIDRSKCVGCGICYRVCPGHEVDFDELNRSVFGEASGDPLIGPFTGIYTGHSTSERMRGHASSGGIASTLLIHALDTGLIDAALVVKMPSNGNPIEPEIFFARTASEILEASGSRYITVSMNTGLREIMRSRDKRFAVVGLPCHIHGLRKAEQLFPVLKDRIVLRIGLMCGRGSSPLATRHSLRKMRIDESDAQAIRYRHGPWPGNFSIKLQDGSHRSTCVYNALPMLKAFGNIRCGFCTDMSAKLADISLGDAWLREFHGENGVSMIIARTAPGTSILNSARERGLIVLSPTTVEKVKAAQQILVFNNTIGYALRSRFVRSLKGESAVPRYTGLENYPQPKFGELLKPSVVKLHVRSFIHWSLPYLANNKNLSFIASAICMMVPSLSWRRFKE